MKNWKAILGIMVTLGLLLSFLPLSITGADNDPVTVSIEAPAEVAEGGSFSADVAVDYVENFNSCSFDVVYDHTVITVTSVTGGEINGTAVDVGPADWTYIPPGPDDTGRIRVIASVPGMPGPGVNGSGYIAQVHFDVLGADGEGSAIGLEGLAMYDHLAQRIDTTTVNGAVEVVVPLDLEIIACGADPDLTKVGHETTFSVEVVGGVEPYDYFWTFGDGGSSTAASPTYTYGAPGTYPVTVTVTDDEGDTDDCSFELVVNPPLSVSDCQADPNPTKVDYPVEFTVTVSGGVGEYTYLWEFGDGETSSDAAPSHTYTVADTYTVTVTVTDELDNEQSCSFDVVVNEALAISDAYADPNPTKVDYSTEFCVTISGGVGPYTYHWDLDDGTLLSLSIPDHHACVSYAYEDPGTYNVTVTVTDSLGNLDDCSFEITVNPPLSVSDCHADPNPTKVGHPTDFSVTVSGGVGPYTYYWDFGDGSSTTDPAPTITFGEDYDGTREVSVTVTDSLGNVQTCSFEITVHPPLSVSDCGANPDPTLVGHVTDFSVDVSGGVVPYTFLWDFGDGETSTAVSPDYAYAAAGNYTVVVTVTDFLDNVQSCSFNLEVQESYTVTFVVTDEDTNPVDGATVALNGMEDTTGIEGRVEFVVVAGTYDYTVSKIGYLPAGGTVDVIDEDVTVPVTLEEAPISIVGQTREADCGILPGVTVTMYSDGTEIASTVSDGDGNYELAVTDLGEYTVVASKDGFRDQEQDVSVTEMIAYTVDFVGDHGLIPDAPDMSYVLACINLWQFGTPPCELSMTKVLAVINAWQFPVGVV